MTRPLRIVVFHLGFFYSGGGEKLVLQQAKWLRERGHEVEVYAPIVDERACFPDLIAEVRPRPLLRRLPNVAGIGDGLTLLAASLFAGVLTRGHAADVYLGANQPGAWLARAAARQHGRRYVVYLSQPNRLLLPRAIDREAGSHPMRRDFYLFSFLTLLARPALDALDRRSIGDAAVRLGDGAYITTILRFYYGGAWRNCPAASVGVSGLCLDARARPRAEIRVNGTLIRGPYVLLTNRHYPQKRFEDMFPVIERVRRALPDATLVITGEPTPYTATLKHEVAARGLDGAIRFLGLVSEAELFTLYAHAATYVYPSPEEDFGMGIVEAMAHGTPVVAWDNAGPSTIIENWRSGALVQLGDVAAFGEAVTRILTDPALADRLAEGARQRVAERFTRAAHTDVLEEALYEAAGA